MSPSEGPPDDGPYQPPNPTAPVDEAYAQALVLGILGGTLIVALICYFCGGW
jgi:hypothetical protein